MTSVVERRLADLDAFDEPLLADEAEQSGIVHEQLEFVLGCLYLTGGGFAEAAGRLGRPPS